MKFRTIVIVAVSAIAFVGAPFSVWSQEAQPPPTAAWFIPTTQDEIRPNTDQDLEQSKEFAKAIGAPKDVVKILDSVPWVNVWMTKLAPPFYESWYGSAVVIDAGTGNTGFAFIAGHMFLPYYDLICGRAVRLTIHFSSGDVDGHIVYYSQPYDLAVLKFEQNPAHPIPVVKIATKDPEAGEELFAIGVPPINDTLQTVIPLRFRGSYSYSVQTRLGPHAFGSVAVERFLMLGNVDHGYSGGPVVNRHGEIQALVSQGTSTFTINVSRKHLVEALTAVRSGQDFCAQYFQYIFGDASCIALYLLRNFVRHIKRKLVFFFGGGRKYLIR